MLRVDGIKAWSDGSNQAGTGYQRDPYLGVDSPGASNHSPEERAEVVLRAHRDGWQVGVHANGNAAIDVTIDAFEAALTTAPGGAGRFETGSWGQSGPAATTPAPRRSLPGCGSRCTATGTSPR